MTKLSDEARALLSKKAFIHLATLMPDGSPQVSPVWVEMDGDHIVVNSAEGRMKDRNIKRDPRVALSVTDPENPYKRLEVRGRVVEITTEGADAGIDRLAKKYMDKDTYPGRSDSEVRVIYRIEPERVTGS